MLKLFLDYIKLKKKYLKNLQDTSLLVTELKKKNYKSLSSQLFFKKKLFPDNLVSYIIDISFLFSNTFVTVMDFSGKVLFFYSGGSFSYSGKNKKLRYLVFKQFYRILISKLKIIKNKKICLHLKNVGSNKFWIIKNLKKKFLIKNVKNFTLYSYNGCKKSKIKRKKIKK